LVARMREHATSVFAEMSHLARRTESINLGQGFPDTDGPALEDAYRSGLYTRLDGLNLDPMHDVLIFSGMVVLAVDGCNTSCAVARLSGRGHTEARASHESGRSLPLGSS
jgi:hypothetical protein